MRSANEPGLEVILFSCLSLVIYCHLMYLFLQNSKQNHNHLFNMRSVRQESIDKEMLSNQAKLVVRPAALNSADLVSNQSRQPNLEPTTAERTQIGHDQVTVRASASLMSAQHFRLAPVYVLDFLCKLISDPFCDYILIKQIHWLEPHTITGITTGRKLSRGP